ncbi:MAG: hypothetical protein ACT4TC_21955, partial [Myxococcaceae bacterium]
EKLIEAERDLDAKAVAVTEDPKRLRMLLSGYICANRSEISGAKEAIADERKKGRIAGVVNMVTLNEAGEAILASEKKIAWASQQLKAAKLSAGSCRDETVLGIAYCITEECEPEELRTVIRRAIRYLRDE